MDREKIALELLLNCPPGNFPDYHTIVEALEKGASKEDILNMPEVFKWPKTYRYLKQVL